YANCCSNSIASALRVHSTRRSSGQDSVHIFFWYGRPWRRVKRLRTAGVHFTHPPVGYGPLKTAVLDDTCGNLIRYREWFKVDAAPQLGIESSRVFPIAPENTYIIRRSS